MSTFVGYCEVELVDEQISVTFPMAVMYPTSTPGKTERLGPYGLNGPVDAASGVNVSIGAVPKEGTYPLVVISHGTGGSPLVYRTIAHHLAHSGFIVGMPEHPFNNRNNNTWQGTIENLTNRPRHLHMAINWFFESREFARFLRPDAVSIIGHSMGGYTALAVAGGVPRSFPHEASDGQPQLISVTPARRVNALILLAPASVWFRENGALKEVDVPILMLVGEKDEYTPYRYHGQLILDGVSDKTKIEHRIVENAGHFSFESPFPKSMTNAAFAPSQDPAGFNRERFHDELNAEILDFLLREVSQR